MPNVFVLCTGRSGSVTFAQACGHMRNFTADHESRVHLHGERRLDYPPNHIEVDNRLSWFLGRLDEKYGDDAIYVHLTRDPEATAKSYSARFQPGLIMYAYRKGIYHLLEDDTDELELSRDYVRTVNTNITAFLKDKSHVHYVRLEQVESDFAAFWDAIGAEGDLDAALSEFRIRHNASGSKKTPSRYSRWKTTVKTRVYRRGRRWGAWLMDRTRSE